MFARLEPSRLKLLAFTSQNLSFGNGEELFRAGEPSDCAYVIMEGEVEVMADTEAGEV
ncbi:MAG: cyclic nucleotide-binding protein, partial [Gammaproteobacteria bacterium]|nr:cyclic nucleotide-binding protein [Gammaproteobacteria bacterium]